MTTFNASNPEFEGVMRRVQKLLAIAGDSRADPNEAAAAAAMAEKVMRKFQIDNQDVIVASLKKGDDLDTVDCTAYSFYNKPALNLKQLPTWANWLASQVAHLMDCGSRVAKNKDGDVCVRFYGMQQDVTVAGWMFNYLVTVTKNLCKQFSKSGASTKNGDVASYRRGVALGICDGLKRMIAEKLAAEAELEANSPAGFSLMVVKQNAITVKYGKFNYPKKVIRNRHAEAFGSGMIDGKKVDLNVRGVGNTAPSKQLQIGN